MKREIFVIVIYALYTVVLKHAFAKCVKDSHPSDYINAILYKKDGSCESELIVNMHISPSFDKENLEKFWVLDETYEITKRSNVKMLSPYLIAVSRSMPISMYPLQYVKSIKEKDIFKKPNKDVNYIMNHDDHDSQLPIILNRFRNEKLLRLKRNSPQAFVKSKSGMPKKKLIRKKREKDTASFQHISGYNQNYNANLGLVRIIKTPGGNDLPEAYMDIPDSDFNQIDLNMLDNSQIHEMENKCSQKGYMEMNQKTNRHTFLEGYTDPYDKEYIADYQLNDDYDEKNFGPAISEKKIQKTMPLPTKENLFGFSADNLNDVKYSSNKEDNSIQNEYYIPDRNLIKNVNTIMTNPLSRSSIDHNYKSIYFPQSEYMKIKKRNAHFIPNLQNHKCLANNENYNFKNLDDNDEIPCDTCGGKNTNSRGKSQNKYDGNLTVSKNQYFNPCHINSQHDDREKSKLTRDLTTTWETSGSYSVYDMSTPLPFVATKINIFRKRHNRWWRVVPTVVLNSLTGIYANENLSILFTTNIDVLQMEKSTWLHGHKLVIQKAKSINKTDSKRRTPIENGFINNFRSDVIFDGVKNVIPKHELINFIQANMRKESEKSKVSIKSFPASITKLKKFPNNEKPLYFKMLEGQLPAISMKIKMPFRENTPLLQNLYKVKISRVITDTTTKDALQIIVEIINKGFEAKEFVIYICNCQQSMGILSTITAKKVLLPSVGESISFMLPLIIGLKKNNKFSCDVVVKTNMVSDTAGIRLRTLKQPNANMANVAKRSIDIKIHSRCFCVWRCRCHCLEKLETYINFNVCEKMNYNSENEAGLLLSCPPAEERNDMCIMESSNANNNLRFYHSFFFTILRLALFILILLFLLGFLKGIFGFCVQSINQFGLNTIQPGIIFECTSKSRIFIVNCFFFIFIPFVFWCKCFRPKVEDLMAASTEWFCTDENSKESQKENECNCKRRIYSGFEEPDHNNNINVLRALMPVYENVLFNDEKQDDDESTAYILEVLEESKNSLSKLLRL
ncbi:uncharacterized protein LOC108155010 isoform X3 [Drosophila miranda]|uniref:uncharacterized protein LOC108155010 isoform X3 n=1 Tax=Drosophila miranda TaxID=7229 RepID=UPI00143F091C|nr:uncharacterized protein LOC108155010 isoform X3 [Drosophila miranda]